MKKIYQKFVEKWQVTEMGLWDVDDSGAGWIELKKIDELQGWFKFHQGDSSTFSAKLSK